MASKIESFLKIFRRAARDEKPSAAITADSRAALLGETALATPRASIRQSWNLLKRYLTESDDKAKGRLLFAGVAGLTLASLGGEIYMSRLLEDFGTAFQLLSPQASGADKQEAVKAFGLCLGTVACLTAMRYAQYFCEQTLHNRWRTWATKTDQKEWLDNNVYNRSQNDHRVPNLGLMLKKNNDSMPGDVLGLGIGLTNAAVRLPYFSYVLMNLGGYMMLGTVAFAAVGTWLGHKAGKPLDALYDSSQKLEAEQDAALAYIQSNAESISMAGGRDAEKKMADEKMEAISQNWIPIIRQQSLLDMQNDGSLRLAKFLSYGLYAPLALQTGFNLGVFAVVVQAVDNVVSSLSWYFNSRAHIGRLATSVNQLAHSHTVMTETAAEDKKHFPDPKIVSIDAHKHPTIVINETSPDGTLAISNLSLLRPNDGGVLLDNVSLKIYSGERVMLMAPAGSGKTTLFRAINGSIDNGRGHITLPPRKDMMMIGQARHIPVGRTLKEILVYPLTETKFDFDRMEAALALVGLERRIPDLYNNEIRGEDLARQLSGGEQQKLAFARVLMRRPKLLLADEPTSALDEKNEAALYAMLLRENPNMTVLNISHHDALIPYHDRIVTIRDAKLIAENPEDAKQRIAAEKEKTIMAAIESLKHQLNR